MNLEDIFYECCEILRGGDYPIDPELAEVMDCYDEGNLSYVLTALVDCDDNEEIIKEELKNMFDIDDFDVDVLYEYLDIDN